MRHRAVLCVAAVALLAVPAASAKVKLSLTLADSSPKVGRPVAVVLRSAVGLDFDLKLIAVAPGTSWYDVVGRVTGDSSLARADLPHDGFSVRVVRLAPNRWRARVVFPRPGPWRLVIPNEAPEGFMVPPPVIRVVVVAR